MSSGFSSVLKCILLLPNYAYCCSQNFWQWTLTTMSVQTTFPLQCWVSNTLWTQLKIDQIENPIYAFKSSHESSLCLLYTAFCRSYFLVPFDSFLWGLSNLVSSKEFSYSGKTPQGVSESSIHTWKRNISSCSVLNSSLLQALGL